MQSNLVQTQGFNRVVRAYAEAITGRDLAIKVARRGAALCLAGLGSHRKRVLDIEVSHTRVGWSSRLVATASEDRLNISPANWKEFRQHL